MNKVTLEAIDAKAPAEDKQDVYVQLRQLVGSLLIELGNGSNFGIQSFETSITAFMGQNKSKFPDETQFHVL